MKLSRRKFLEVLGLFGGMYLFTPGSLFQAEGMPLRPPGAVPEGEFLLKCIRCFKCGEICPTNAIKFGGLKYGKFSETPILLDLTNNPCNLCMECTNVCPSGALTPIQPNAQEIVQKVKIGLADIDRHKCFITTGQRKVCYYCVRVCPLTAVDINPMRWPVIREEICVGCGLCQQICPAAAINVWGVE